MQKPKSESDSELPLDKRRIYDKESDEEVAEKSVKQYLLSLGRDILTAVIVMVIIISVLYFYTGNWPPMVVIESNSMMHGDDSSVGVIDTGDLVLVKNINNDRNNVKTYVDGARSNKNYETYNAYGDVIIFRKNGLEDTPVIHRAVVWLEYNASGSYLTQDANRKTVVRQGSFDIPSLKYMDPKQPYLNVTSFYIPHYKPNAINLTVDLRVILNNYHKTGDPHDGFLTKGDNNDQVDQLSSLVDSDFRPVEPVKVNWIVGKAQGELPWFGIIKLWISGDTENPNSRVPNSSFRWLVISIVLIIAIPIALDILFTVVAKFYGEKKKKAKANNEDRDPSKSQAMKRTGRSEDLDQRFRPPDRFKDQRAKSRMREQDADFGNNQRAVPKDELLKKIR